MNTVTIATGLGGFVIGYGIRWAWEWLKVADRKRIQKEFVMPHDSGC